jgi:hypothetical protein
MVPRGVPEETDALVPPHTRSMDGDLYAWKEPSDLDAEAARALVDGWLGEGGEPASSPFEPSTDVAWFHRELVLDGVRVDTDSDAAPPASRRPIFLQTDEPPPAHVVVIRQRPDTGRDDLDTIVSLAAKYDLVLFDRARAAVHHPLQVMAAQASADFWPRGAIRAAVVGGIGLVGAIVAWNAGIPILSGLIAIVGGFMALMAVVTFAAEGRSRLRR